MNKVRLFSSPVIVGLTLWSLGPFASGHARGAEPPGGESTSLALAVSDAVFAEDEAPDAPPSLLDKITNPVPWLEWGMDIRLRETYMGNVFTLDRKAAGHEWHWQRQRVRIWTTVTPVEDVEFNLRLAWEGKHYDRPLSRDNWAPTSLMIDWLNVKLKSIGGSPFTLQAGRQELMLGDRWLVMDGTPLDGSSSVYFDAVRLTAEFTEIETRLDLIYLEQDAHGENWFYPISNRDRPLIEQDETGAIVWVTNTTLPQTQLDGYFIYKKTNAELPDGDDAEIYTIGARAEHRFNDRWKLRGNLAGQFGRKNGERMCAFGALARLTYATADKWNSVFRLDYEYLSGDDPGTDVVEAFDTLWGRWPRFSELYIFTYAGETRLGDMTNLHRLTMGWTGHPTEKMELRSDYHLLFADQNTFAGQDGFSGSGCFRGQLLAGKLAYKFTDNVSGHLVAELFFPGDYYTNERNDPAAFLRAELSISF